MLVLTQILVAQRDWQRSLDLDKLLMNKFIRQNFGGILVLKTLYLERLGADSVEA